MVFDRLPILSATAMLDCVLSAYFVLVRLAASRMNFSHAYTLLEQAESSASRASGGGLSRRLCSSECGSLAWRAEFGERRLP